MKLSERIRAEIDEDRGSRSGPFGLWAAVFLEAVRDLEMGHPGAESYFNDESLSFRLFCLYLEWPMEKIKERVLKENKRSER